MYTINFSDSLLGSGVVILFILCSIGILIMVFRRRVVLNLQEFRKKRAKFCSIVESEYTPSLIPIIVALCQSMGQKICVFDLNKPYSEIYSFLELNKTNVYDIVLLIIPKKINKKTRTLLSILSPSILAFIGHYTRYVIEQCIGICTQLTDCIIDWDVDEIRTVDLPSRLRISRISQNSKHVEFYISSSVISHIQGRFDLQFGQKSYQIYHQPSLIEAQMMIACSVIVLARLGYGLEKIITHTKEITLPQSLASLELVKERNIFENRSPSSALSFVSDYSAITTRYDEVILIINSISIRTNKMIYFEWKECIKHLKPKLILINDKINTKKIHTSIIAPLHLEYITLDSMTHSHSTIVERLKSILKDNPSTPLYSIGELEANIRRLISSV